MLRTFFALLTSRIVRRAIRAVRPGGGSSVPGRVAAKIQPNLVSDALSSLPMKAILVSGSAGKSTTTKQLVDLLRGHGLNVFTNPSTSNIRQGFFSAVLTTCNWRGQLPGIDIAVIEVDEGHGPALAKQLQPQLTILTNVMSDQLDRFVDPEFVVEKLLQIALHSEAILINSDDQNLLNIASRFRGPKFSISSSEGLRKDKSYPKYAFIDSSFENTCHEVLTLVDFKSDQAKISHLGKLYEVGLAAPGAHMALNASLAVAASIRVMGKKFDWPAAQAILNTNTGVFARWESVELAGATTRLVLVQNPASFQLNLDLVDRWPQRIYVGIGRDVHDPSWLWTVDMRQIPHVDVLAGFNAPEAAARLETSCVQVGTIESDIPTSVDIFLGLPVAKDEERIMIITADAMRRVRRHLRLAK